MSVKAACVVGELKNSPPKERLAEILRDSGLRAITGRYSVRIEECSHFVFQQYGGDLGKPAVDADADSPDEMLRDAEQVSAALARAGVAHRFEVFDQHDRSVGCFSHDWAEK